MVNRFAEIQKANEALSKEKNELLLISESLVCRLESSTNQGNQQFFQTSSQPHLTQPLHDNINNLGEKESITENVTNVENENTTDMTSGET